MTLITVYELEKDIDYYLDKSASEDVYIMDVNGPIAVLVNPDEYEEMKRLLKKTTNESFGIETSMFLRLFSLAPLTIIFFSISLVFDILPNNRKYNYINTQYHKKTFLFTAILLS